MFFLLKVLQKQSEVVSSFQTSKTTIEDDTGGGMTVAGAAGGGGEGGVGHGEAGPHPVVSRSATLLAQMTGRRQKLPVPKTETEGINLWNLGRTQFEAFLSSLHLGPRFMIGWVNCTSCP